MQLFGTTVHTFLNISITVSSKSQEMLPVVYVTNEFLLSERGVNGTYTVGRTGGQGVWNCNPDGPTE